MSLDTGWKGQFDLRARVYLDGATQGPIPRVAIEAVGEALELKRDPSGLDDSLYFTLPDRIRAAAAPFFACDPHEIAVSTGASAGVGLLAHGIDWNEGDHVVVPSGEFPAVYLPWLALRAQGVEVGVVASAGGISAADVEAALRPRTRAVAMSFVNFATGFRADVEAIGELCADRGIAYVVDASQGLAAVPLDVRRCKATIVAAAGYKWMCSPYGTGVFYVHPDWVERLPVPVVNWESVAGAEDFNKLTDLEVDYRPGAVRWDSPETAAFLNGMPMAAALEFLGDIGVERIFEHSTGLLDSLLNNLPDGFRPDSSLEPEHRSTILRIVADDPERTLRAYDRCVAAGISVGLREGGIRVSPGVWNDTADIEQLLDQIRDA